MATEREPSESSPAARWPADRRPERWARLAVALAALCGLALLNDAAGKSSATYDEVTYLRVASRWWRTGDQKAITRMGSPLTFWKLQQAPALWMLGHTSARALVDKPVEQQEELLPLVRLGSLWIWLVTLLLTAAWSRRLYGPRAMALAAWLFALAPNLLAHGGLVTMELPLVACTTAIFFLFWHFLQSGSLRAFWGAAALGGLAWSCKFTTVLVPPILGLLWWCDRWRRGERRIVRLTFDVAGRMLGFVLVLLAANVLITGFALLPISEGTGAHPVLKGRLSPRLEGVLGMALETPIPQDWAGFATQMLHQRAGGPSYLFGARRMHGWWYYYFVALAVKVPLGFWLLVAGRIAVGRRLASAGRAGLLPAIVVLFLAIAAAGSSRNYGLRYILPLAPLAIVWVSGLAECGGWMRRLAALGLLGQAIAVASVHPYELCYFNELCGGPIGGRRILADSNLDWGQGLKALARLQHEQPQYTDLTLYYFGDTAPSCYRVEGQWYLIDAGSSHPYLPPQLEVRTKYVAVSASLQWGPWGPEGYFRALDDVTPERLTDDATIAIYRWPLRSKDR
jgi:4-amino-4-deoxy-L-arabinose transferase-like glycosyltransferase